MRVLFSLFLLLPSSILLVAEDDPAVKQRETQVKQLILLLDSDQLSSRQAAEKELLQLGPSILTLLPSGPEDGH
mgnify:CR=1 FL=1